MKFEVKKIGWDNENPITAIVCLSKRDRQELGTDVAKPVRVKITRGEIEATATAIVQLQFREFVGEEKAVTISKELKEKLSLNIGDKIEITNDITESEYEAFSQIQAQRSRELGQRMFESMFGQRRGN